MHRFVFVKSQKWISFIGTIGEFNHIFYQQTNVQLNFKSFFLILSRNKKKSYKLKLNLEAICKKLELNLEAMWKKLTGTENIGGKTRKTGKTTKKRKFLTKISCKYFFKFKTSFNY